jgi:hypothetical protein
MRPSRIVNFRGLHFRWEPFNCPLGPLSPVKTPEAQFAHLFLPYDEAQSPSLQHSQQKLASPSVHR